MDLSTLQPGDSVTFNDGETGSLVGRHASGGDFLYVFEMDKSGVGHQTLLNYIFPRSITNWRSTYGSGDSGAGMHIQSIGGPLTECPW